MRGSRTTTIGVLLSLAVVTASVGLAQDRAAGQVGQATDQGELSVRTRQAMTLPAQLEEGVRIEARGTTITRRVTTMLANSRRERDVIRVTCLNDKLTQLNAALLTARTRVDSLRGAVHRNDTALGNHEYTVLAVLGTRFLNLEQEANHCAGEDLFDTGPTQVTTTIDPNGPTEDPSAMPASPPDGRPVIPPPLSVSM